MHQQLVRSRWSSSRRSTSFDVFANLRGGGITGQAGGLRLAIARALIEIDPDDRPALKKAGFLTRDAAGQGAQEVRSEEGPQGPAVLEALTQRFPRPGAPWTGVPGRFALAALSASTEVSQMGRLFGTDGVRGRANADLTPELAMAVAIAAAQVLFERDHSHAPLAVVGRDPRASGEMLEAAVVAGLTSAGANVSGSVSCPPRPSRTSPASWRRHRRDAVRLAQPDARQRDQALRRRRAQDPR